MRNSKQKKESKNNIFINLFSKTAYLIFIFFFGQPVVKAQYTTPDSIVPYVDFIKTQKLSAKEYILDLFNRYDIVVFCERTHDELTQYHLLTDLFSDERFYNRVGNIFMEMGGSNFDKRINDYLFSPGLTKVQSREKALEIQRNVSWYPLWERYNYHYLLTSLYEINRNLPNGKKLALHPTDIAVDWNEIKTKDDVLKHIASPEIQDSRDIVMGANIISYIAQNAQKANTRKKYFIILNTAHATNGTYKLGGLTKSATSYIFDKFPKNTANVLINYENVKNMFSTVQGLPETLPILDGKWDAAFEYAGIDDLGFDIKGSPLEGLPFENFLMDNPELTNEKVFTGYVFYKAFPGHEYVNGVPGIVDENFLPELKRRYSVWFDTPSDMDQIMQLSNITVNKKPDDMVSYWQKVTYWSGGGKPVLGFYNTSGNIDETIQFISAEREKGSNSYYNVSETGINIFGYALMSQGKNDDALKAFKLNTELYLNASNTWDSYGEALLKLGRTAEAKEAYKKALELNPGNTKAKKIVEEMKD